MMNKVTMLIGNKVDLVEAIPGQRQVDQQLFLIEICDEIFTFRQFFLSSLDKNVVFLLQNFAGTISNSERVCGRQWVKFRRNKRRDQHKCQTRLREVATGNLRSGTSIFAKRVYSRSSSPYSQSRQNFSNTFSKQYC